MVVPKDVAKLRPAVPANRNHDGVICVVALDDLGDVGVTADRNIDRAFAKDLVGRLDQVFYELFRVPFDRSQSVVQNHYRGVPAH